MVLDTATLTITLALAQQTGLEPVAIPIKAQIPDRAVTHTYLLWKVVGGIGGYLPALMPRRTQLPGTYDTGMDCPHCGYRIPAREQFMVDGSHIQCSQCKKLIEYGGKARTAIST